jgi:hypothetical protein
MEEPSYHVKAMNNVRVGSPPKRILNENIYFNSASIATFGDQSKAAELRVLTCLEMLEHSDYYNTRFYL